MIWFQNWSLNVQNTLGRVSAFVSTKTQGSTAGWKRTLKVISSKNEIWEGFVAEESISQLIEGDADPY